MDKPAIVVSGLGRCGSSLAMQMLVNGGLEATGGAHFPYLEDRRAYTIEKSPSWLTEAEGKALKILGPDIHPPPEWFKAKTIWMRRDPYQQAISWKKAAKRQGTKRTTQLLHKIITSRTMPGINTMKKHGPVLVADFEAILKDPKEWAEKIAEFVDMGLNKDAMVRVVQRRGGKAKPEMAEDAMFYDSEFAKARAAGKVTK